jgi:hypothetical protein
LTGNSGTLNLDLCPKLLKGYRMVPLTSLLLSLTELVVPEKLVGTYPRSEWREDKMDLGCFVAPKPKGSKNLAQRFNP